MFVYEAVLEIKEYKYLENIVGALSKNNVYVNEYTLMDKWFNKNIRIKFLLDTPIQEEKGIQELLSNTDYIIDVLYVRKLRQSPFVVSVVRSLNDIEKIYELSYLTVREGIDVIKQEINYDNTLHIISGIISKEKDEEKFIQTSFSLEVMKHILSLFLKEYMIKTLAIGIDTLDDFINVVVRYSKYLENFVLYNIEDKFYFKLYDYVKQILPNKVVLFYEYDILSISDLVALLDFMYRYDLQIGGENVGFIGITSDMVGFAEILSTTNVSHIYGYDENSENFILFEKKGGMISDIEYLLDRSSIVIVRDISLIKEDILLQYVEDKPFLLLETNMNVGEGYHSVNPNVVGMILLAVLMEAIKKKKDDIIKKRGRFLITLEAKKKIAYRIFDFMEDGNLYHLDDLKPMQEAIEEEL